ncbi:MAG: transporter [Sandaracinaceae bacterium]
MTRCFTTLAAIAAVLALADVARAQEGELPPQFSSDRPGFANTTATAAVFHLTTEMGAVATISDDPTGSLPNLRLRFGLLDWLEARVIAPSAIGDFGAGGPRIGLGDMALGFKVGSAVADTVRIAMVWDFTMPTATERTPDTSFGSPEVTVTGEAVLDWSFWGPLTLTPEAIFHINAELDPLSGETVRVFDGGGSLKLTWQIIDSLGVFVQSYVLKSELSDVRVQVGGGIYFLALPNWQLDASFDTRVTEQGDDPTVQVGTTILWM